MTFVMLPVDSVITQPFGVNPTRNLPANHPTILAYGNYQAYGHDGIDFGCWEGTPVRVPGRGMVAFSGFGVDMPYDVCIKYGMTTDPAAKWSSGIIVILDHGNGIASYYAHLSRSDLDHRVGQWVEAGTVMGLSGNTGRSGGPHLHWSALVLPINYQDGLYSRRNPLDYVTTVNVISIAPGNEGAPASSSKPAPKKKEWYEMPIPKEDLTAIARAVHHAQLPLNKGDKAFHGTVHSSEHLVYLAKFYAQESNSRAARLEKAVASQNAQIKGLVGAIAALTKGEPFDEAKLLAGVQAAAKEGAREGVAETIDSIDVTVNTKGA